MNRLRTDDRVRVLACLVEGNSQRATVRTMRHRTFQDFTTGKITGHDCFVTETWALRSISTEKKDAIISALVESSEPLA